MTKNRQKPIEYDISFKYICENFFYMLKISDIKKSGLVGITVLFAVLVLIFVLIHYSQNEESYISYPFQYFSDITLFISNGLLRLLPINSTVHFFDVSSIIFVSQGILFTSPCIPKSAP